MGQASQRKKILTPLDEVGLEKIADIEAALEQAFGKERADAITKEWGRLSEKSDADSFLGSQTALYDYLHSDLKLSMIVTNYTDAAIIRAFCLWLYDHRNLFGKEILDVGCGTGIISCFLGRILPKSHITAIDRSEGCIQTAEWVKETMGASNVDFYHTGAQGLEEDHDGQDHIFPVKTFDTVLSVRTFHENIGIRKTEIRFRPFSKQVETYKNIYREYCEKLSHYVADGGRLVCIERNRMDTELLGLFYALQDTGLSIEETSIAELQCAESDFKEPSVFQTFSAVKPWTDVSQKNGKGSDSQSWDELFHIWREKAFSKSEDPEYFTRAQADWFMETEAAGLIEGYTTYDANGTQLAKACLLKKKNNPEQFLMYQANYYNAGIQLLPNEALEEAKELFADHKAVDAARGFEVKDL